MLHSTRIMKMYNFILQNVRQITSYSFIENTYITKRKLLLSYVILLPYYTLDGQSDGQ